MPAANCHPNHKQKHPAPYLDSYCSNRPLPENPRGKSEWWCWWQVDDGQCFPTFRCPYGKPGDLLYVREVWNIFCFSQDGDDAWPVRKIPTREEHAENNEQRLSSGLRFRQGEKYIPEGPWRPGIHMPRWASRLTLRLTDVRVEQVQDISEGDARAEGIECDAETGGYWGVNGQSPTGQTSRYTRASDAFNSLWESINGKRHPWAENPWVWVLSFEVLRQNVDEVPAHA